MRMKSLTSLAGSVAVVTGLGAAMIALPQGATANETAPEETRVPMLKGGKPPAKAAKAEESETAPAPEMAEVEVAEADTSKAEEAKPDAEQTATETSDEPSSETNDKEDKTMSKEATAERTPEEAEAFRQTMHEGDIALGVCGARVSALLWFYEASVAQGREDLKAAVASLTESREAIKSEAERRAVDDGVDTSVRVMNAESEKLWDDLNEKAAGDAEEFQKAHDELYNGVQECLALFFDRPGEEKKAAE